MPGHPRERKNRSKGNSWSKMGRIAAGLLWESAAILPIFAGIFTGFRISKKASA
jgi:hypothetical protein